MKSICLLWAYASIADDASEVVHTPGLVECEYGFSGDNLIARVAKHAKQLLVVEFAVCQTLLLVVA